MIGKTLDGKYHLIRLLGEGGMGAVYEAERAGTGERVAVKVIAGRRGKDQRSVMGRFQREAKAAAAIETEHIVKVLDSGTDPATGKAYIAMEQLRGEDLEQVLRRLGPLPPSVALKIVAQASVGLQKAHEARVVHRDIKPANLFLAEGEGDEITVKILDFGIAKIKPSPGQGPTTGLTATGNMLGSPLYMSPEQVESTKTIDHRTDLWSLGVVLYRAIAGRAPHEDVPTVGKMLVALCTELPRPVQQFAPWVAPEVAAVVHRAVQFDVDARFQSAAAMLDAMRPLLPDGWRLCKEELVGLSDDERAEVAPRLRMPGIASTGESRSPSIRPEAARTPAPATEERSRPVPVSTVPPPRSNLTYGLVAVALALIGYFAYDAIANGERAAPDAGGVASSEAQGRVERVMLVVSPSDVSVDVDGKPAEVRRGTVEITGAPGSIHEVRLWKGAKVLTNKVILTEVGAVPPRLELIEGAPGADGGPAGEPVQR